MYYASLCCVFRGKRVQQFSRATAALNDKEGKIIHDSLGISNRWVEHFSEVEGGHVLTADQVVQRVLEAEANKSHITVLGQLRELPSFRRLRDAIGTSCASSACGPDGVGNTIYRDLRSIQWAVRQHWGLSFKTSMHLSSLIQSRGGELFSMWKRAAEIRNCKSHRTILLANNDDKNVSKSVKFGMPQDCIDKISHNGLL